MEDKKIRPIFFFFPVQHPENETKPKKKIILPDSGKKLEGKAAQTQPTIPDYSERATFNFKNLLFHLQPLRRRYLFLCRGRSTHRPTTSAVK